MQNDITNANFGMVVPICKGCCYELAWASPFSTLFYSSSKLTWSTYATHNRAELTIRSLYKLSPLLFVIKHDS